MVTRKANSNCLICAKEIYRRPSQIKGGPVFCSLQCCGLSQQQLKTCRVCNKKFTGAKVTCSRSCSNKSRSGIHYTGRNDFNKAYRGKALKEQIASLSGGICIRCKENNFVILQVHHKTERANGGTNDISNLELLCPNCHAAHHLGFGLYNKKKML